MVGLDQRAAVPPAPAGHPWWRHRTRQLTDLVLARRRPASVRAVWWLVLAASTWLLAGGLLATGWLGFELYQVKSDVGRAAGAAADGRFDAVREAVDGVGTHSSRARAAADRPVLSVWQAFPPTARLIGDLRRLAGTTADVAVAADDGVALLDRVTGRDGSTPLASDGQVHLEQVPALRERLVGLSSDVEAARGRLQQVRGGWLAPGLGGVRDSALSRLDFADAGLATSDEVAARLPSLLGADGRKRYLFAVLNPSELRPGGGAPLALAVVRFDDGRMSLGTVGQTYDLTKKNKAIRWKAVEGNAFYHPDGATSRLVNTNMTPDFPTAAQELVRGYEATKKVRVDGLVTVDTSVLAGVLKAVGPVRAGAYGRLSGATVERALLVDAYYDLTLNKRRQANNTLIRTLVGKLSSGGGLAAAAPFTSGLPGRHVQVWLSEPKDEALLADHNLSGEVVGGSVPAGVDVLSTFTQNTNASKVDFYQHRAIDQQVTVHEDGSADVVRRFTVLNDTPEYEVVKGQPQADPGRGYYTSVAGVAVIGYAPPGASDIRVELSDGFSLSRQGTDHGMDVIVAVGGLPRGASTEVVLRYSIPRLPQEGDGYRYRFRAQTQAGVTPTGLTLRLQVPQGWRIGDSTTGSIDGTRYRLVHVLDTDLDVSLSLLPD